MNFNWKIQNEVCVVDFTVKWSPACVTMEEKLQDIARDFSSFHFIKVRFFMSSRLEVQVWDTTSACWSNSLNFIKMDLDVDDEILYNMDIKALPTIMVFKNAKGVGRIEGLREPVVRDVLSKLQ